jgi:hypothetical protein
LSNENEGFILNCFQSLQSKVEEVNQTITNTTESDFERIEKNNPLQTQNFITLPSGLFSFVKRLFSSLFIKHHL